MLFLLLDEELKALLERERMAVSVDQESLLWVLTIRALLFGAPSKGPLIYGNHQMCAYEGRCEE